MEINKFLVRCLLCFLFVGGGFLSAASPWAKAPLDIAKGGDTNQTDKKGKKQGLWVRQDSSRRLCYTGYFKDDRPQGEFIYTNPQGLLVGKAFYFREGYASYHRFFYPDGQLLSQGYYLDKQKDSLWVFYRPNGSKIKEEFYQKGLLNGESKLYNDQGYLIETMIWFRGLRQGRWWKKEPGGFQSGSYHLNKSEGPYFAYYPDSTLYIRGVYEDGVKEGMWSFYLPSPSKSLYKEEVYKQNQMIERSIYLKIEGKLRKVGTDSLVSVFSSALGRGDLFTQSGLCLHGDESFETVCKILELDYFFYANERVLVSFKYVRGLVQEGGQNRVELKVSLPFSIYANENGEQTIRNMWNLAPVEAQQNENKKQ